MLKRTTLRRIAGVAAIAAIGLVLTAPSPAYAASVIRIENSDTGYNARVTATQNNVQAVQSSLTTPNSVKWEKIEIVGGALEFKNVLTHKCLDGRNLLQGSAVVQWTCDPGLVSQWWIPDVQSDPGDPNEYRMVNGFDGLCLAVQNATDGSGLVQLPCSGLASQNWLIPAV